MNQFLDSTATAIVFGILLGVTSGIFRAVSSVVWPAFYGRTHLGSIFGFATAAGVLGAALGPVPFGVTRDLVGSYQPILYISAVISLILGAICLSINKPINKRTELIQ
jgi:MFS family permease